MDDFLTDALKTRFAPLLRADGFTGSGQVFRRRMDDLVHVVEVQRSRRHDARIAVNLGIQPLDIPDVLGQQVDPRRLTEPLCEFRRRLSETGTDQWWSYGRSAEEANSAVEEAARVYVGVGRRLFEEQSGLGAPLRKVTADDFAAGNFSFSGFGRSTKARMAMVLARMRLAKGEMNEARDFALVALKNLGPASSLKEELEGIIADAG